MTDNGPEVDEEVRILDENGDEIGKENETTETGFAPGNLAGAYCETTQPSMGYGKPATMYKHVE